MDTLQFPSFCPPSHNEPSETHILYPFATACADARGSDRRRYDCDGDEPAEYQHDGVGTAQKQKFKELNEINDLKGSPIPNA